MIIVSVYDHDLDVKIFGTHGSTWYSMNHI